METKSAETNLEELFYEGLVKQIRAMDSYGSYAKYTDDELAALKFVKKDGAEIAGNDPTTLSIKLYLQTISVTLERISGHIIGLMTEAGCDGSVKAMFYSGQLILFDKTFGGIGGLQFPSLEKLKESGGKLLNRMKNIIQEKKPKYEELMG